MGRVKNGLRQGPQRRDAHVMRGSEGYVEVRTGRDGLAGRVPWRESLHIYLSLVTVLVEKELKSGARALGENSRRGHRCNARPSPSGRLGDDLQLAVLWVSQAGWHSGPSWSRG